MKLTSLLFSLFFSFIIFAQPSVYPPHWWADMKLSSIQLMIYGEEISTDQPSVTITQPGITILQVHYPENTNYLFVDIEFAKEVAPGKFSIEIKSKKSIANLDYELKPRRPGNGTVFAQGVTSEDFIYLLMPDRFSNGNPSNDRLIGMRDQSLNRDSIFHRHGGDLEGITSHLDYLHDLGVTALWMTPVIQNDMPDRSEHGYAFTNHYKIEPRFGGESAYRKLSDELHNRGMKLVQDGVYNHVGLYHFTVQDMPMKNWLHVWPKPTNTTYKDQTLFDPYASASDKKQMSDGWFTPMMPDLNQQNPFVAKYLIQHALWCVEEFGIDGWRIDTYAYNDLEFMNQCNKALMEEYPAISLFGETWVHGVINQAYFTENNLTIPFKSNLPATTDFQSLFYGILPALTQPFGWTEGVNKLYQTVTNDIVYKDPTRQVIFLDNHDLSRIYSVLGEDVKKVKVAFTWLLTFRGVPQMYYGDEILMKGITDPDGWVRLDFPGGWAGDKTNKFTSEGRTKEEQEVFNLIKTLANFRKQSSAIKTGKFMHYLPVDGLYVYFRYDDNQTIMCIMNTSTKEMSIDFPKYNEQTSGFASGINILSHESISLEENYNVPAMTTRVIELNR